MLVECVPNFSEGRNKDVIEDIVANISAVEGVSVLDVEMGDATNRTVVTFIGSPGSVEEAAFRMIVRAAELIDMSTHEGAHPRMGATDVCPFVPVSGVTMEECVEISKRVAERVGSAGIPVYLYEESASAPHRANLAEVRRGQYEGLEAKMADPEWAPDLGPATFDERVRTTGATTMGAREFLIAYNVNVNSTDVKHAKEIAFEIRERGRALRDEDGEIVRDAEGKALKKPGKLKAVKAIGWYIDEYSRAQVSINLINYRVTPLHAVFETCVEEAEKLGVRITGSEIIGMVPLEPLVEAGRYFLRKQGRTTGVPVSDLIDTAVVSMGLNEFSAFVPEERIIELITGEEHLTALTVHGFVDELSRESPAPGGGSVASLAGAMGAGLTSMVATLTHRKKGMEDLQDEMLEIGIQAQMLQARLIDLVDTDTEAFNKVMAAFRMKKRTEEEQTARDRAVQEAYVGAAEVPLETMEAALEVMKLAERVAVLGNPGAISDAGSAAVMALAAVKTAGLNVRINVKEIEDDGISGGLLSRMEAIETESGPLYEKVMGIVRERGGF
jgi:glutamate formiminotransferase/formiminotetrahydrofolate cyclodeaminase